MSFIRLWFLGYSRPAKMMEALRTKPAPQWGFYGQFLRSVIDSLVLYLPVAIMGRTPPAPSNISILPTEQYYWHLIWLSPLVLGAVWLLSSAFIHLMVRFVGRRSDYDQVLNIVGMATIVVGASILVWDWLWFALGGMNQYLLGLTHLAISLWAVLIEAIGLKRILGIPIWLGFLIGFLTIPIALPFGIMFMRSPF